MSGLEALSLSAKGWVWCPTAPIFPRHVPGHMCMDTPGRGSAKWALSCGLRTSLITCSLLAALVFGHCHTACGILVTQRGTAEKAMAPHSSTLAWKISWIEEPGRLQSMGSLSVGHDWATFLSLFTFMHWRRKWQPTPVFLPGESQGWGSLVGCHLWGGTELDTTEVT